MSPNGKGIAALIVSKMKPSPDSDSHKEEDQDEGGDDEGCKQAAEDMLKAIKSDDSDALCKALGAFVEMYEPKSDSKDEDEDE